MCSDLLSITQTWKTYPTRTQWIKQRPHGKLQLEQKKSIKAAPSVATAHIKESKQRSADRPLVQTGPQHRSFESYCCALAIDTTCQDSVGCSKWTHMGEYVERDLTQRTNGRSSEGDDGTNMSGSHSTMWEFHFIKGISDNYRAEDTHCHCCPPRWEPGRRLGSSCHFKR